MIFSSAVCAFLFPFIRNWQITDPTQQTLLPALFCLNRMLWTPKHSLWHKKMFSLLFKYQNDCWSKQGNPIKLTCCTDRVSVWHRSGFFSEITLLRRWPELNVNFYIRFMVQRQREREGSEASSTALAKRITGTDFAVPLRVRVAHARVPQERGHRPHAQPCCSAPCQKQLLHSGTKVGFEVWIAEER